MQSLPRRTILRAAAGAAGATWFATALPGCATTLMGNGPAFEPWTFPTDESSPEVNAVHAAVLAASPHNTQPWLFRVESGRIDVFADERRSLGAMDSLHRELFLGLGCAVENAVRAAAAFGRQATVTYEPDPSNATHAARLVLTPAPAVRDALFDAIPKRRMNKRAYTNTPVPADVLEALRQLPDDPRVVVTVVATPEGRGRLRQLSIDALEALTRDPEMAEASHRWWRQTKEEIERHRDGLNLDIMGLDAMTLGLAAGQTTVSVEQANSYWLDATRGRHGSGAAYFVVSSTERNSRTSQLLAGRLFQRAHLFLTTRGVDMHTMNMAPELQDREESTGAQARPFTARCQAEVPEGHGLHLLTRIGYATEPVVHTPRRPVADVLRA
jgi:hypothetical protein